MTLAQLLTEDHIIPDLAARDRWAAIREMAQHLLRLANIPPDQHSQLLGRLYDRENRQSTGIGGGLAIPHALAPDLKHVLAVVGRSMQGIDFESIDDAPVYLVVLFLVPNEEHQVRMEILSAIGKTLHYADVRQQLMNAASRKEMHAVLSGRLAPTRRLVP